MSEEWDEKDNLSIKFILDVNCQGQIGVTYDGHGGAYRFCGKFQCVTITHRKSQIKLPRDHWLIQDVPQYTAGILYHSRIPST